VSVPNNFPALSIVDVVINPSVRGWSETFCIANIEAMSMSLPLVTFAAGGVGQYVSAPADESYLLDDNKAPSFSVTDNAVVVHEAHPEAIAAATRVRTYQT
jgi:glycosyltransferase involved in cell wall biosynthesis